MWFPQITYDRDTRSEEEQELLGKAFTIHQSCNRRLKIIQVGDSKVGKTLLLISYDDKDPSPPPYPPVQPILNIPESIRPPLLRLSTVSDRKMGMGEMEWDTAEQQNWGLQHWIPTVNHQIGEEEESSWFRNARQEHKYISDQAVLHTLKDECYQELHWRQKWIDIQRRQSIILNQWRVSLPFDFGSNKVRVVDFLREFDDLEEHDWNCHCKYRRLIVELFDDKVLVEEPYWYAARLRDQIEEDKKENERHAKACEIASKYRAHVRFIIGRDSNTKPIRRYKSKTTCKPHSTRAVIRTLWLGGCDDIVLGSCSRIDITSIILIKHPFMRSLSGNRVIRRYRSFSIQIL